MIADKLKGKSLNTDPRSLLGNWEEKKRTRNWQQHFIEDIELAVQLSVSNCIPLVRKVDHGLFEVR